MKKSPNRTPVSSVDGFIPRRPRTSMGELNQPKKQPAPVQSVNRTLHTGANSSTERVGTPRRGQEISNIDINDSLRDLDEPQYVEKKSRRQRKMDKKALKKPKSKARRIIKWVAILLLVAVLAVGGYVVWRAATAGSNVFQGNLFDVVTKNEPLKQDANGRSNFVIFGTAEDDEGGEHGGANLTDSIMLLSVDQTTKNAYMISLPRDLWVAYEETCWVGNQGKLNAAYSCASDDGEDEKAGAAALQKKIGEILGVDIQYYVHLNFTAVVQAVDAVGGVDVTINSEDPRGILDRNFDWKCGYRCYMVKYENGQKAHLDGEHALALARARNASGGYGLPNGNFDREKNQQMIIKALREKAVSAGTLLNVGSVTSLIDALGNNLRTNIDAKEVRTLMDLGTKINTDAIISLSLNEEGKSLVTTGMHNGQSIVRPIAGLMNYSEIIAYMKKNLTSDPFIREEPALSILNGSGTAGLAQVKADALEDEGFIINSVGNAPDGTYQTVEIYQINAEKTASAAKLKAIYGVAPKTTPPPVSVVGETDFLIIFGADPSAR